MRKLSPFDKHLLKLCRQGQQADGWCPASSVVMPLLETLPGDLIELQHKSDGSGAAKLTDDGNTVLDWS